jgi:hypothetical protein
MKINFLFLNFKSVLTCEVLIHFLKEKPLLAKRRDEPKKRPLPLFAHMFLS